MGSKAPIKCDPGFFLKRLPKKPNISNNKGKRNGKKQKRVLLPKRKSKKLRYAETNRRTNGKILLQANGIPSTNLFPFSGKEVIKLLTGKPADSDLLCLLDTHVRAVELVRLLVRNSTEVHDFSFLRESPFFAHIVREQYIIVIDPYFIPRKKEQVEAFIDLFVNTCIPISDDPSISDDEINAARDNLLENHQDFMGKMFEKYTKGKLI